jgi:hypothetical protein
MDEVKIVIDEEIKPEKVQAEPGVPWEKMKFKVNARDFAKLMREYDIRTAQDVRTNTNTIVRLMQRLYAVDLGAIATFAKEYEEGK